MTTQITLKIKDQEGNTTKQQHEIEEIDLMQFQETMKIIKDVFKEVQEDESLKGLFADWFAGTNEEGAEEMAQRLDETFIQNAINSFETLAIHMPEKAFKLLSVLSGVPFETLRTQKVNDVFDIYDAVVEENDLQRLFNRAKKSLAATKAKMTFLKIVKKATKEPAQA